jgi:hypothetical protein
LKIPKRYPEAKNRRGTDNTMTTRKKNTRRIYDSQYTMHIKLKIQQQEPHYKPVWNSCASKGLQFLLYSCQIQHNDSVTRTLPKTGGKLMCTGREYQFLLY